MRLLKFFTPNCAVCKAQDVALDALLKDKYPSLYLIRMDATQERSGVREYGVVSVPTLVFEDGDNTQIMTGYRGKEALDRWLDICYTLSVEVETE